MTDNTPGQAATAALNARIGRLVKLQEAWLAYRHDVHLAQNRMPAEALYITRYHVKDCRTALEACLVHLDEIERHMDDSPLRGMQNDIGPSAWEYDGE